MNDKEIYLTRDKVAIVSQCDYERVSKFKWYCSDNGYAVRIYVKDGKRTAMQMHRFIMDTPDGMETDHINGDRLDNRRSNLRICTSSQNRANARKRKPSESGYFGVRQFNKRFQARITIDDKNVHIGMYDSAEEAAIAWNAMAKQIYGEFAKQNNLKG